MSLVFNVGWRCDDAARCATCFNDVGFAIRKADRATLAVVFILAVIFSSMLIAYGTQIQLSPMRDTVEHGNNSNIWYRDEPLREERNNSDAATARLPALFLALEKLRLTHFQAISHVPPRDIGEYDKGVWLRKAQLDQVWLRLFDNVADLTRVCHLRLGAGYMPLLYLEALPDASIVIYDDACFIDGPLQTVCDTIEAFYAANYPSRSVVVRRVANITDAMLQDSKNGKSEVKIEFRFFVKNYNNN